MDRNSGSWLTDASIQQGLNGSDSRVSVSQLASHLGQLTRWKYVGAILSIEPTTIDFTNILGNIPGGVVGPERVDNASLGVAGHVNTVSNGRCRL